MRTNLNQNLSGIWIRIQISGIIRIRIRMSARSLPKMLWIHYLVSISHFAEARVSWISAGDCRRFWHATQDCVASYVDIILHRGRFWDKSVASGSIRWCCFRSCRMVLSHEMQGRPSRLLQSVLSSMHIICPNRVSRHDWIIAVH